MPNEGPIIPRNGAREFVAKRDQSEPQPGAPDAPPGQNTTLELSIIMPCLNEARTLPACIRKAKQFLDAHGVSGEVIVADNGSTDGSREIAESLNARVVRIPSRGYGSALMGGIEAASGNFVIMGDSDDSYDFSDLMPFVEKLRGGYDLVMGNRFRGGIAAGAMPFVHRYFGNPLLTAIGRRFFKCKECGDFYCGLRGFRKAAIQGLELQCRGMEFALEMIIKACMHNLRITEVPATLSPDGRDRAPHLRSYRDGWRSLRLYLLMSPRWFFGVPGVMLLAAGFIVSAILVTGPVKIAGVAFDYHTLLYAASAVVLGYQAILLAMFAKLIAVETGLHPPVTRLGKFKDRQTVERSLIMGSIVGLIGVILGVVAARKWSHTGFGDLQPSTTIRLAIVSVTFLLLGAQTVFGGFFFGLINLLAERGVQRTAPISAPPNP